MCSWPPRPFGWGLFEAHTGWAVPRMLRPASGFSPMAFAVCAVCTSGNQRGFLAEVNIRKGLQGLIPALFLYRAFSYKMSKFT